MSNTENLQRNVMSGANLCQQQPQKRARLCSDGQERQSVQLKLDELRTNFERTKIRNGVFAYFWYDSNHPYFLQNSLLTHEHTRNWPANTGTATWRPDPGAVGLSSQMAAELTTYGKFLKYQNTEVFRDSTNFKSLWLNTINGDVPPTIAPFSSAFDNPMSMTNYMIVQIDSDPYFKSPPDAGDMEILCPNTNEILGTYMPVVDCHIVATRPNASQPDECIPCDSAPAGESLYRPDDPTALDRGDMEIPICMLWGVMPNVPLLPPPRWILTQTLGRTAKSARAPAGPTPLWHHVDRAGGWAANPFRQLVAASESGDYAVPAVSCCYDDMYTNCNTHRGNKDQCINKPNCTWNSETMECLQGMFENSCANADCSGSTRVTFSEHILATPGEECCKPILSCVGMDYSNCISKNYCNWDKGDSITQPRCNTRACNKGDCGGDAVTTSVSGTAPNCNCTCKAPAVGQNYCYVANAAIPPNQTNCFRRLSDRCRDRLPTDNLSVDELNDCIRCVEENSADDDAAGCTNNIRGLFCANLTCSGHPTPDCFHGQTLKPDLDIILKTDNCCTASCEGQSCPWDEELKPSPETIPRSQGCCIAKNCEDQTCPSGHRLKANPATIRLADGCCDRVGTYSNKRIIGDCDDMHHVALGSNQKETCSTAAAIDNGTWRNCEWDDNFGPFNDCDYASEDLGTVQLLPVGSLPDATIRPIEQKHVWYKGLSADYNVVDDCNDECVPNTWVGGVTCSDGCTNKIDKYGRVCQYTNIGNGALICVPRIWNRDDSNAASMDDYTGGILSTPN